MKDDLFLIPGITPGFTVGQSTYNNVDLKGWSYGVELRGFGTLNPGIDINYLSTGGFEFINGYTIQSDINCVIHFNQYTISPSNSNYTNGIDIANVLPELENRIGWRQPKKAGSPVLNSYNLQSKSGRFFDSFHSLEINLYISSTGKRSFTMIFGVSSFKLRIPLIRTTVLGWI